VGASAAETSEVRFGTLRQGRRSEHKILTWMCFLCGADNRPKKLRLSTVPNGMIAQRLLQAGAAAERRHKKRPGADASSLLIPLQSGITY
jgi:hypothetical protein